MKDNRMDNIVECAYNMDNGYVEVWFTDGNMLRIKCEEVEAALRTTEQSLAKLHKLLDNKPIEYVVMALSGEMQAYCDIEDDMVKGMFGTMIEPYDGTLYDPCCGSGGMFIQSAELVKSKQGNLNGINIYGQEKEPATYRLAKMNLALRGISHNLGDEADSSFTHDLHKGLYFNYIMANPPFNLKGWYNDNLKNDPRWTDYATPPASNANFIQKLKSLKNHKIHVHGHLKNTIKQERNCFMQHYRFVKLLFWNHLI